MARSYRAPTLFDDEGVPGVVALVVLAKGRLAPVVQRPCPDLAGAVVDSISGNLHLVGRAEDDALDVEPSVGLHGEDVARAARDGRHRAAGFRLDVDRDG